jgi:hypothetical protein
MSKRSGLGTTAVRHDCLLFGTTAVKSPGQPYASEDSFGRLN